MIPDSFKQDLLNRIDVVELVERYVPLKKAGANYAACCPFHSEKSPSFTVSPTKQFYHCFGCGAHGNAISFLMEYQGLGYIDALKELAESVGMKLPEMERGPRKEAPGPDLYEVLERASRYYRDQLKGSPQAIEYLKGRGLTGRIAARFGIGYAPAGWQNLQSVFTDYDGEALKEAGLVIDAEGGRRYDRFRDRVMFPILNQRGSVIGFGGRVLGAGEPKYLNSPETPLFEKGRELYGLSQARNAIRSEARALVTEGYMDVVALAQHGIEYAVATLGTATSVTHLQKLFRMTDEIVFCFDGDAAGRKAAWHALEVALPVLADNKVVRFMFLPEEDDPDTFVRQRGKDEFEQALAKALPLSEFFLSELKGRENLNSAEGRARLLAVAEPFFKKVAAPVLKLQLQKQLLEAADLTPSEISQLTGRSQQRASARPPSTRPTAAKTQSRERSFIRYVLVKPGLASIVPVEGINQSQIDGRALMLLLDLVKEQGIHEHAHLIEALRDSEFATFFDEFWRENNDLTLDAGEAEGEMRGWLVKMESDAVRQKIMALSRGDIDEAGKLELQALTKRLNDLTSGSSGQPTVL